MFINVVYMYLDIHNKLTCVDLCVCLCVKLPGGVRLCCKLSEERSEHPHRLHPLHVHLRCYRCAALQGQILLLHR